VPLAGVLEEGRHHGRRASAHPEAPPAVDREQALPQRVKKGVALGCHLGKVEGKMIDQTNANIEQLEEEIARDNSRRYAFQRMLKATDRVLWRLEEMNRDGVKTINSEQRVELRDNLGELPQECLDIFRDTERVQDVLDSVFELQERLFRIRHPEFGFEEEESLAG
jgi:septal ring factor EnvC (AmiA/AmiB activator)